MIDVGDPLRRAHAWFVVRLASVPLALLTLSLLRAGHGWPAVSAGVGAWVVVVAWSAVFGDPWPHLAEQLEIPARAARATQVDGVSPVTRDDLRPFGRVAAGRVAIGVLVMLLTALARDLSSVGRYPMLLGSARFYAVYAVVSGLGRLWYLRRLSRTPLTGVPVTVAAVGVPAADRVLLVGPTLAWTVDRRQVLAGVVPGDVVVVHLDPANDDPEVVTDGRRRSLVTGAEKATPAEVEQLTAGGR